VSAQKLMDTATNFAQESTSKNTRRTYSYGWKSFAEWSAFQNVDPISVSGKEALIAFFVSDKASNFDLKVSSIATYLAAIRSGYMDRGIIINMKHPAIVKVLKGVRRKLNKRPVRKEPILTEDLREMIAHAPIERDGKPLLAGLRDRALLLMGFAGAFRRSELVALNVEDLTFTQDGVVALIRRSKTDQEGAGMEKHIPFGSNHETCPVLALKAWLTASCTTSGSIYRSVDRNGCVRSKRLTGDSVAIIIKKNKHTKAANKEYSGHSLRAGFATSAAKNNVPIDIIAAHVGHKSIKTTEGYIRRARGFVDNAATMVGL